MLFACCLLCSLVSTECGLEPERDLYPDPAPCEPVLRRPINLDFPSEPGSAQTQDYRSEPYHQRELVDSSLGPKLLAAVVPFFVTRETGFGCLELL